MLQIIQVITKLHFCKISNPKMLSCLKFFLWLKTLPQCFVFDTIYINWSTNQILYHAINNTVQASCISHITTQNHAKKQPCYAISKHYHNTPKLLQNSPTLLLLTQSKSALSQPHICTKLAYKSCIKKAMKTTYPNNSNCYLFPSRNPIKTHL